MKKAFGKDMIVLCVALIALACAAVNLNISLNKLGAEETLEEE